jgi:hypothetical protein
MRYFHYTVAGHYESIVKDGFIKRSTRVGRREIPGVCISTNENWEETVRFKIDDTEEAPFLSRDDLFRNDFGPLRIEIDRSQVNLKSWKHHKKHSGISVKEARGLEEVAKRYRSNPKQWFVCYNDIPLNKVLSVELWDGTSWRVHYKRDPNE